MPSDWTPEEWALSRQISRDAEDWILDRTVAIFAQTATGIPVAHGTGILLKIADVPFLVSAAHVLDVPDRGLLIGVEQEWLSIGGRPMSLLHGHHDFGVMRLTSELEARLVVSKKIFLRLDEIDPSDPEPEAWYFVVGYPRQLSTTDHLNKHISGQAWAFSTVLHTGDLVNATQGVTIALTFAPANVYDEDGELGRPPALNAISGCGIWRVMGSRNVERRQWNVSSIRLVGIEHRVFDRKAIVGVLVRHVIAVIRDRHNDLAPAIDLARP